MFTLLEAEEPPDFGPPLHIHHGIAEAFYVLEGAYIIFIRGTESSPAIPRPVAQPHRSSSTLLRPHMVSGSGDWRAESSPCTCPLR